MQLDFHVPLLQESRFSGIEASIKNKIEKIARV